MSPKEPNEDEREREGDSEENDMVPSSDPPDPTLEVSDSAQGSSRAGSSDCKASRSFTANAFRSFVPEGRDDEKSRVGRMND